LKTISNKAHWLSKWSEKLGISPFLSQSRFFVLLSIFIFCHSAFADDDGKITITPKSSGLINYKKALIIENADIVPRILKLSIFNGAVDGDLVQEIILGLPPKSRLEQPISPAAGKTLAATFSWRYKWLRGTLPLANKENAFWLPFLDGVVKVCQFFDGPITTHQEKSYAIDFCAPEKTPIAAAKSGQVLEVVDYFTEGGFRKELYDKFNYVRILHDDGMQTLYGHIYPKSANVAVGDRVERGQLIALVGQVGYASGPHLHFEAQYPNDDLSNITVNPNFFDDAGTPIGLSYGIVVSRAGVVSTTQSSSSGATNTNQARESRDPEKPREHSGVVLSEKARRCSESKGDAISRANECLVNRNYQEAIKILSAILKKNPSIARAQAMLGLSYAWQGEYELAIPEFEKAVKLGWSTYDLYAWYAKSLDATGKLGLSIKYNRAALRIAPWLVDVTGRLSEQLVATGHTDQAISLLKTFDAKQREAGKKEYFSDRINQLSETSRP